MEERIYWVIERLEKAYGRQSNYSRHEPMKQLILTILSQRTNYADERKAYEQMMERFKTWEGIAHAPVDELTAAIAPSNYPEIKAPRIQEVIKIIIAERGKPELDFLENLTTEEAVKWLRKLPGVGPKTTTFLLLFTFKRPVLPVDTHVYRVSQRVGLIGSKVNQEKAHEVLLKMLPPIPDELVNFHRLLFKHGQQVCSWNHPKCTQCVLKDICDFGRSVLKIETPMPLKATE